MHKMIDIGLKFRNPKSVPSDARRGEIRNRNQGFTMMELMITIGILAIALAMVSALFPVAVIESNNSYKDVVGTMICENGLAVAKTLVTGTNRPSSNTLSILADEDEGVNDGIISLKSQHYQELLDDDYVDPDKIIDDPNYKIQGFGVLGREFRNAYQLIIVSYHRPKDHRVLFKTIEINSDIAADAKSFIITGGDITTVANRAKLVGSPVIAKSTGLFSKIIAVNGSTVMLERPFGELIDQSVDLFVLIEEDENGDMQTKSPAFSVLVTLTGL